MSEPKVSFLAASTENAQKALGALTSRYGSVPLENADIVVSLGGDGFLLHTLHGIMKWEKPVFGMNLGTHGFLCNEYEDGNIIERLVMAESVTLHPLLMVAKTTSHEEITGYAFNEVSMLRQTRQSCKLRVSVDGIERIPELNGDGLLVATAAGSTAYNLSVHGPIIPIGTHLLALTPIAAHRPRRWRGALLPAISHVQIDVLESEKRPTSAVADYTEAHDVQSVSIKEDRSKSATILFDPKRNLAEKVFQEQFLT